MAMPETHPAALATVDRGEEEEEADRGPVPGHLTDGGWDRSKVLRPGPPATLAGVSVNPIDLTALRTCDLHARPSKVHVEHLGRVVPPTATAAELLDALPKQLGAEQLRKVASAIVTAHKAG